jgi:hypothetical protein
MGILLEAGAMALNRYGRGEDPRVP